MAPVQRAVAVQARPRRRSRRRSGWRRRDRARTGPRGADVIVHDLTTGRDQLLGSVGEISFNKKGDLLAYTVDASPRDGNGLFVLDLRNGRVNPLENDARVYNRLTWNDDGTGLAVLKGVDVDKMRERDNILVAYPNVQSALTDVESTPPKLDPSKAAGFPKGFVVSDRATLDWSGDGRRVFFGMKEQVPAPDTSRRRNADEVAGVDVWNTKDERIQSVQMTRADADRNFTYREAFDLGPRSSSGSPTRPCEKWRSARTGGGPSAATSAGMSPITSARPPTSIASTRRPANGR